MTNKTKICSAIIKATDAPRKYRFIISTDGVDRDGDIVYPQGISVVNYRKNPVVFYGHDYKSVPIGKSEVFITAHALEAEMEFAPTGLVPLADQIRGLVDAGVLRSASIGFKPTKAEYNHERKGLDIYECELLEWSIVGVPSNAQATIQRCIGEGCTDLAAMNNWLKGSESCGCDELPPAPSNLSYSMNTLSRTLSRGIAGAVFADLDEADATPETVNKFLGQAIPLAIADIVRHEVHQAILYHTGRVD